MDVGVVRVAEDRDFLQLKNLVDIHDGWKLEYNKPDIQVFTKATDDKCNFKLIKIIAVFSEVEAETVYDVLHDPDYRKEWDNHMLASEDIGFLNINNDIGYYAMSCPSPLKNRDFVLQRSWLDTGTEQMILNHSVYHKDYPPKKGFVRAISQLTGWVVRNMEGGGCRVWYVSRTDPRGKLPAWLVNIVTKELAPKMAKRLRTVSAQYPQWKTSSNNPYFKPWRFPDQILDTRIKIQDCIDTGQKGSTETLTEEVSSRDTRDSKKKKSRRLSESD